jgi:guanylate kinase
MAAPRPVLLLISAPSGAGKTTVSHGLLAATPGLERAITCTTRPPRGGERDGVDYHFLTAEDFARRVAAGEFLEHATVYGRSYGTLKAEVISRLRAGRDVLLSVDVQGAASIRAAAAADPELRAALVTAFLAPPSLDELRRRLTGRGEDAPEVIARRLAEAEAELAHAERFDHVVRSGTMAEDLAAMQAILRAAKARPPPAAP